MKYVYVLRCGDSYYKVGIAKHVVNRVRYLQTSNPEPIRVIATRLVEDAYTIEQRIHKYLEEVKSGGGNEWFKLTPEQVIDVLLMINEIPEILTVYDIIEINKQLKILTAKKDATHKKLDIAIGYIKRKSDQSNRQLEKTQPKKLKIDDSIYKHQAMEIFIKENRASASLLQTHMGIGYAKAARIVAMLVEEKKLGDVINPTKGRKILVSV